MTSQLLIPGCDPTPREDLSQHFTPRWLAKRMVEWAKITPGMHVLEPSAGSGAFVAPLLEAGARVQAIEIDPEWAGRLRLRHPPPAPLQVDVADFLAWEPLALEGRLYDLCVINPPYEDDQDLAHVLKALELSRRAVVLVRVNFLYGIKRYEKLWTRRALSRKVILPRRPHFSGAGGPRHDFCVIELQHTAPVFAVQSVLVEHWL